eukprot:CAMPEP_0176457622 /NCGR_PEP_ID=MMETSP0127-20121128/32066_1 /TAXON_ID=938130 /ORGANISM="Platyophrya macrostoma, Strain WH" /LENGTH=30 /DNA_ID= /DNA_START= /DNA_END= /DNA_ORIENTATION=
MFNMSTLHFLSTSPPAMRCVDSPLRRDVAP